VDLGRRFVRSFGPLASGAGQFERKQKRRTTACNSGSFDRRLFWSGHESEQFMPVTIKRSKRYKKAAEKAVTTPVAVDAAVDAVKAFPPTKFDQSVELIFSLGIDAKQADQMIRGSVSLPHGIGKSKRVVAFCPPHLVEAAKAAGAVKAGGQELVQEIEKDNFTDFDVAVATPDMMRFVGRLGKVLGPKGLMPSPKAGTVTADVGNAVREYAAGKIEFRNDSGGNVHCVVGKISFDKPKLVDNINAMLTTIRKLKPATSKGAYFKKVVVKGSMTPAVQLTIQ
jgi:large subunit ribosomal protein L1